MKKEILIETIFDVEGQVDSITVSAECEYSYTQDNQIICYNESTEDGIVPTKIIAEKDCVDIIRDNPAMPDMHMRKGETVSAEIQTPYGNIPITTIPKKIQVNLDENGGTVLLEYVIDIGGADSKNRVSIAIK